MHKCIYIHQLMKKKGADVPVNNKDSVYTLSYYSIQGTQHTTITLPTLPQLFGPRKQLTTQKSRKHTNTVDPRQTSALARNFSCASAAVGPAAPGDGSAGKNCWNCSPKRLGKKPRLPAKDTCAAACACPAAAVSSGSGLWPAGRAGVGVTPPPCPAAAPSFPLRGSLSLPPRKMGMTFSREQAALHTGHVARRVLSQRKRQGQQYRWPHCVTTGSCAGSRQTLHTHKVSSSSSASSLPAGVPEAAVATVVYELGGGGMLRARCSLLIE